MIDTLVTNVKMYVRPITYISTICSAIFVLLSPIAS